MNYIIYIDVYFFVNFFMNGLLLYLLGWSEGKKRTQIKGKKLWKIVLGALIGGILSCLFMVLFPEIPSMLRFFLVNGVTGYLMVWAAFDYKGVKKRLLAVERLYLMGIILSGILNLFLERQGGFSGSGYKERGPSDLSFLPVAAAGFFAILVLREVFTHYRREKQIRDHLYVVHLFHRGKAYEGVGLLDTGNHLREPITGRAVVVVSLQAAKKLLGKEEALRIAAFFRSGDKKEMPKSPVKWIPYHSLGEQHGFMPGVIIEKMVICQENKEQVCEDVLIGIMEEELSGEQLYQLILHEEYVEFG